MEIILHYDNVAIKCQFKIEAVISTNDTYYSIYHKPTETNTIVKVNSFLIGDLESEKFKVTAKFLYIEDIDSVLHYGNINNLSALHLCEVAPSLFSGKIEQIDSVFYNPEFDCEQTKNKDL